MWNHAFATTTDPWWSRARFDPETATRLKGTHMTRYLAGLLAVTILLAAESRRRPRNPISARSPRSFAASGPKARKRPPSSRRPTAWCWRRCWPIWAARTWAAAAAPSRSSSGSPSTPADRAQRPTGPPARRPLPQCSGPASVRWPASGSSGSSSGSAAKRRFPSCPPCWPTATPTCASRPAGPCKRIPPGRPMRPCRRPSARPTPPGAWHCSMPWGSAATRRTWASSCRPPPRTTTTSAWPPWWGWPAWATSRPPRPSPRPWPRAPRAPNAWPPTAICAWPMRWLPTATRPPRWRFTRTCSPAKGISSALP